MKNGFALIEMIIVFAIVSVLVLAVFASYDTKNKFMKYCDEIGGKTLFDGRQYQCLKH
jgi:prepilin-type N-terminal cleavage/methylation domain-containing protein